MLSFKASHLLSWIIDTIDTPKDYITIDVQRYLLESKGYSYVEAKAAGIRAGSTLTYKSAVQELVAKGFLARTFTYETYFINPRFFFFGSRPAKYPECVKEHLTRKEIDDLDAATMLEMIENANELLVKEE